MLPSIHVWSILCNTFIYCRSISISILSRWQLWDWALHIFKGTTIAHILNWFWRSAIIFCRNKYEIDVYLYRFLKSACKARIWSQFPSSTVRSILAQLTHPSVWKAPSETDWALGLVILYYHKQVAMLLFLRSSYWWWLFLEERRGKSDDIGGVSVSNRWVWTWYNYLFKSYNRQKATAHNSLRSLANSCTLIALSQ